MSEKVKSFPRWYEEMADKSPSFRKQIVETVLKNVSCHGSSNDKPTPLGKQFVGWIRKEFELIGFAPNAMYLRVSGADLQATFIHPWAMITLLYKHKKLPFVIQVNSGMRKDEMMLAQIPYNKALFDNEDVIGLTS